MLITHSSELQTKGRLYVRYPADLRIAMRRAIQSWEAFCALPDSVKLAFGYTPDAKVSGNGYELKRRANGGSEDKEDFHIRKNVGEEFLRRAMNVDAVIATRFVEDALVLNSLMAPIVRSFAETIESDFGIPNFVRDVMSWQDRWLVRFLHYFGDREPGEEFATPHVDKGGFTLHLYESHPGVERLEYATGRWVVMPLSHDETVIIPGMGLQNRSRCRLRALCHRVVVHPSTARSGRFSSVCFFNFANVRFYDKAKHGRLQDKIPGFNYNLSFDEFDKFFTD